jgi:hypothetical protein
MTTVTNKSAAPQPFVLKDGTIETLEVGETRELDVDEETIENVARKRMGTVIFGKGDTEEQKEAVKRGTAKAKAEAA